jgi:Domain of unknown function (DUF397)
MIRDGKFRKATGSDTGDCVEVALLPGGGIRVRDSKDRAGGMLAFGEAVWQEFTDAIRGGKFDLD